MKASEKIKKAQFQCNIVNQIIPKIDKYFIEYCKAVKEAWSNSKFCGNHKDNYDILEKYNLGNCYDNYYNKYKFNWNYEIEELNKLYKQCLK